MPTLSIGANIVWQIAAGEASDARFQFIEAEHIFIGICSIEKLLMLSPEDSGLNPRAIKSLQAEHGVLKDLMGRQHLDMTQLRRTARKEAGAGSYKHTENVIHRSPACKMMFERACAIASPSEDTSCLHILAAILENPGNVVSQALGGKRIIELNLGALIGGTKYRGEFEERLTRIIEETRSNPNVILFIDEIHNLVGAGRGEGSLDAANIMKPVLARGELRCIGATTIAEYRRYIESDPALERRFEKIIINEPTRDEAIEM